MKNRSTQDPFPEEVTNRPRDLRLIAMSGAVRQARHEPSPTWMLVYGVLLGILICMGLSLWREAEHAASERHGQLPAANPTGAASAQQAFDLRLARSAVDAAAEITTYGLAYRPTKRRPQPRTVAVDAADALSREMDRRDRERDEAQQRLSADFDRAWEALYEQFGDAWRDHDAQRRARENVWRIFNENDGDPDATIAAVMALAEAKGVLA